MKHVLILIICMLLSAGVLCASTTPIPANLTAPAVLAAEGAWSNSLIAGDGGPAPYCAPGKPCNNDQLKLQAGDGGPAPYCAPGKPCNNDQERLPMAL
jgi:glycine/D-amino acid oxidase-like deaminating enzyme